MIDIAPAMYGRPPGIGSGVLECRGASSSVVGIVDGMGSWGFGVEAADWVLQRLVAGWSTRIPSSAKGIAAEIADVARQIPDQWQGDDVGCSFSVALIVRLGATLEVVAAGTYNVWSLGSGEDRLLFRPRRWIDEQVRLGNASAAEALVHPLRGVTTGPFVADNRGEPPEALGPFDLASDAKIVIAEERVMDQLLAVPSHARPERALEIQELGARIRLPRTPVVVT
jgi:hypothetical protein